MFGGGHAFAVLDEVSDEIVAIVPLVTCFPSWLQEGVPVVREMVLSNG